MAELATHKLFLLFACKHNDTENSGFVLYSFSDKLRFEFDKPFLHEKFFIGSQHGWLSMLNRHCEPSLLNPLTGESVSLPSFTTLSRIRPHHSANGDIVSYFCRKLCRPQSNFGDRAFFDCLGEVTFKKILISSNPSTSLSNFFAAALLGYNSNLVVAKPGASRWKFLQHQEEEWYMDIMFRQDGKLICLTNEGSIHEVELKDDNFVISEMTAPFLKQYIDRAYLAEDCASRVLVIHREYDFTTRPKTCNVKVFGLINGNGKESKLERVKSLGGQAIFVGTNASISLTKQDIRGEIKADTIYFTDEWWEWDHDQDEDDVESNWLKNICAYNLMSNSIKPCCPDEHQLCPLPLPIWIHLSNPK
ncbi:F-box only protein 7 [Rhynchospora pubera]|uniref:F-box only protein 7 n=1 Tax=Rhynchospora pubera TaxID=906938 RepID=A0AAV8DIZ0_9POAL|nr:F-box only protein 7 [Rhynchospora pubera]